MARTLSRLLSDQRTASTHVLPEKTTPSRASEHSPEKPAEIFGYMRKPPGTAPPHRPPPLSSWRRRVSGCSHRPSHRTHERTTPGRSRRSGLPGGQCFQVYKRRRAAPAQCGTCGVEKSISKVYSFPRNSQLPTGGVQGTEVTEEETGLLFDT